MIALLLLSLVRPGSPFLHLPAKPTFNLASEPPERNRDAETISNTGDLYMAQLKLDSAIRKRAFLTGDDEVSQATFKDPRVGELLETEAANNPNLKRMRAQESERDLEMKQIVMEGLADSLRTIKADDDVKQVSYRERLAQAKRKRSGDAREEVVQQVAQPVAQPVVQEMVAPVVQQVEDVVAPEVKQVSYREKLEQAKREKEGQVTPTEVREVVETEEAPVTLTEVREVDETKEAPIVVADEAHKKLRLLQGLLFKHRGGVGFGAGRLKGPEVARLQSTLGEVADMLHSEIDAPEPILANVEPPVVAPPTPLAPLLANVEPRVVAPVAPQAPVPPAPVPDTPPAPVATQTTPASQESILEAMNFAASAMETYKLAPPQAQSSLTGMVKTALLSVLSSIEPPTLQAPACPVKPPPALQTPVCPVKPPPAPEALQSFSEIAADMDFRPPVTVAESSNSLDTLKQVQAKLSAVAGSGPSGLNLEKLDARQARDLAGELDDARRILLDELDL